MTGTVQHTNRFYIAGFLLFLGCILLAVVFDMLLFAAFPFACILFCLGWQSIYIPFLLLIASIPFSMELQISKDLGTDIPDELLMILTATVFVLHWIWKPGLLNRSIINHPLFIAVLIGTGWSVITSLFSVNGILSLKYLLAKTWYLGAFFGAALIVFQQPFHLRLTARIFSASMFIVTVIVFVKHAESGFTFISINDALRPYFRNHVNYSALLVCIFPLLLTLWLSFKNARSRLLLLIPASFLLVVLVLTYARGAWLALIVGMIAWWLIRKRYLLKVYLLLVLMVTGIVCWLAYENRYLGFAHDHNKTIFHENFREHLVATYQLKDMSTAERFYRWIAGVMMVKEKPLMGFGPSTFYESYKPYTVPAFKTWVSNNPEHSTVHNYFLLMAIEQGIPGLLTFLIICGLAFYYAEKGFHDNNKEIFWRNAAIVAGSIFAMLLTVNFLSDLIETDKIGSIFYLALATLISANSRISEN